MFRSFIIATLFLLPFFAFSQAIENTNAFHNISSDHYFRINYENDFFTASDRDYTQGFLLELVNPSLKKFFLSKLLWHPKNGDIKYGISFEDDGYTPNHIDKYDIQYGDRPYAGVVFFKTFLTTVNSGRKERISTLLSTGLIGPDAGGEAMQKDIHHWISYTQPLGWHNQVADDAVLNYQVMYEKEIFSSADHFSFSSYTSGRIGTLSTKATAGITMMAGNFYSPFKDNKDFLKKKCQWYFYYQPLINIVGYDATLQGGLFNHSSPYTIPSADISRVVFQHKYGLVVQLKHIYIEYFQTGNTQEFSTSVFHRTGGLQVGFGF